MKRQGMSARVCVMVVLTSFLLSGTALAWDDEGHMIVAALAYDKLTPEVRSRADALLKLNPAYEKWVTGVQPDQAAKVAFVTAATWPDFIKTDEAKRCEHPEKCNYTDDKDVSAPEASQNVGYADLLEHRYWHYKDLPFSTGGVPVKEAVPPNAETQIDAFRAALASPDASDELKSYDLAWLLHLVGDVHQPLHATSRFSKAVRDGDQGGNLVCLGPVEGGKCKLSLHLYWDEILGKDESAAAAIAVAETLAPPTAAAADDLATADWLSESEHLAETQVYVRPFKVAKKPLTIIKPTATYHKKALKLANERVSLAGARLAALLNAELK